MNASFHCIGVFQNGFANCSRACLCINVAASRCCWRGTRFANFQIFLNQWCARNLCRFQCSFPVVSDICQKFLDCLLRHGSQFQVRHGCPRMDGETLHILHWKYFRIFKMMPLPVCLKMSGRGYFHGCLMLTHPSHLATPGWHNGRVAQRKCFHGCMPFLVAHVLGYLAIPRMPESKAEGWKRSKKMWYPWYS